MKKILKSLFVVVAVSGLAVAATSSFFSDTETSTGNRFQAGAIDLTVDSEGHYNGYECVENKWQDCTYDGVSDNLLANDGFESPEVTSGAGWDIFTNGTAGLAWTVEWESSETTYNSVDRPEAALAEYHEGVIAGWNAYEGDQYAELDTDWDGPTGSLNNEPARVRIYQMINTDAGKKYQVSYAYSPRPDVTNADDNTLIVRFNGAQVASHARAGNGSTTDWTVESYEFEGTGAPVKIEFAAGGTANSLGVFLDKVEVREVNRTCTIVEEHANETCYSTWNLDDLGPEHKFFNFQDLKPGDWGENTISLHVENNDAHACMYFDEYAEADESLTEPEEETGDDLVFGELGKYTYFFAWRENDGDNVYEDGEEALTEEPVLAKDFLSGSTYFGVMDAGTTGYVGLAWCFGQMSVDGYEFNCDPTGDHNEAQTDSITTNVGFYVEQARNNPKFACPVPGEEVKDASIEE